MNSSLVIAGLDPAIHTKGRQILRFIMDALVEPAHDETEDVNRFQSGLNRNQTLRVPVHLTEKSCFFAFALFHGANSIPYLLNQKVKP